MSTAAVGSEQWYELADRGDGILRRPCGCPRLLLCDVCGPLMLAAQEEAYDEWDRENVRRRPRSRASCAGKRDDFRCKHCGTRDNLSVDHIHPESLGGTLDLDNLQTLCMPCNARKGVRVE